MVKCLIFVDQKISVPKLADELTQLNSHIDVSEFEEI